MPLSVTWVACYTQKNVPWHILAPSAVACDIFHLRASAHLRHVSASFCNMEPMLQKERGQETCNASFLTPLSAYILCTTLFFMQCSLPYLFSFVKRFFNFSSSHVAFCRQISCSHENLPAEGYRGSAALMSKNSCAAAENIADAIHDNRMFAERAFYCMTNGAGELDRMRRALIMRRGSPQPRRPTQTARLPLPTRACQIFQTGASKPPAHILPSTCTPCSQPPKARIPKQFLSATFPLPSEETTDRVPGSPSCCFGRSGHGHMPCELPIV